MNIDFTFVITGHRSVLFAKSCIESIQAQLGGFPFSSVYVDDASNYSEEDIIKLQNLLKTINGELLLLKTRHYQIGALSKAIPLITSPDTVVCLIDGDDYLLSHAVQTVAVAYANPDIAITYGNVLLDFRPYQNTQ